MNTAINHHIFGKKLTVLLQLQTFLERILLPEQIYNYDIES